MHIEDEEALKQYVSDALECLKIKFVNNVDDVSSAEPKHKVEYAYQQFGDSEGIFGYKNLQLTLCYSEATMFPHLIIEHDGIVEDTNQKPDDIYKAMATELVDDQKPSLSNKHVFAEKIQKQIDFEPYGTEIPSFIEDKETGKKFALFRLEGELTEDQKLYLERIQSILFFYIEGVRYTDSDDERFMYYVLYEIFESDAKTGRQYRLAAYGSYYKYFHYTTQKEGGEHQWRLRAAHTFVFPRFRGMGLGAKFLHSVSMDIKKNDEIYDITLETPAPELVLARDACTISELITMEEFAKDKVLEPFTKEKAEIARKAWKMYKGQVERTHDILKYAVIQKKGKDALKAYTDDMFKRYQKIYQKKAKDMSRMAKTFSDAEIELACANEVEAVTDAQIQSYVDRTVGEYELIIQRLQKHSDAFRNYV